ncbi:hypothetical protein D3C87_686500 [compost metagenome]
MRALFDAIFIGRASFMKVDHVLSPGIMIYLCRMGKVDITIIDELELESGQQVDQWNRDIEGGRIDDGFDDLAFPIMVITFERAVEHIAEYGASSHWILPFNTKLHRSISQLGKGEADQGVRVFDRLSFDQRTAFFKAELPDVATSRVGQSTGRTDGKGILASHIVMHILSPVLGIDLCGICAIYLASIDKVDLKLRHVVGVKDLSVIRIVGVTQQANDVAFAAIVFLIGFVAKSAFKNGHSAFLVGSVDSIFQVGKGRCQQSIGIDTAQGADFLIVANVEHDVIDLALSQVEPHDQTADVEVAAIGNLA